MLTNEQLTTNLKVARAKLEEAKKEAKKKAVFKVLLRSERTENEQREKH